jgi:NAD-dependent SIR2 family protein deacetylase
MGNRFTTGKIAIAECDRCGQQYKLKELKPLTIRTKITNILVCEECWEPDHPQNMQGMYPVDDPQAVRNPRPDFNTYPQSRALLIYSPSVGAAGYIGTVTINVT